MAKKYDDLPTFDPGRDQSRVSINWSKWLEVWDLFSATNEWEDKDAGSGADYKKVKTLKPLFLLKIVSEAREVYNSKAKADRSDKLVDIINFMSQHFAPKQSIFAYVALFYKSKRHQGESVNDYVV